MFPRVGGAALALAAAALLAVALFVTPWWLGHPSVDHQAPRRLQTVDVSPLGAHGCNTGGDGKCTATTLEGGFKTVGVTTGIVGGVAAGTLVLVGVLTLMRSERRRPIGKIAMAAIAGALLVGIVLLVLGPGIKAAGHTVEVPKGIGFVLFFVGGAMGIAAGIVTAREIPRAVFVPKPRPAMPAAAPGGFDVAQLIGNDQLRPSQPAIPSMAGAEARSPGGALAGPSGPLAPPGPLFAAAPQLRPLYEMEGMAPVPAQPMIPDRAPTPLPTDAIARMRENDQPSPVLGPRLPPPVRSKAPSLPPPPGSGLRPKPPTQSPFDVPPLPGSGVRPKPPTFAPGSQVKPPLPSPSSAKRPTPTPFDVAPAGAAAAPFGVLPPPRIPAPPPVKPFTLPKPPDPHDDDFAETHEARKDELTDAAGAPFAAGDETSPSVMATDDADAMHDDMLAGGETIDRGDVAAKDATHEEADAMGRSSTTDVIADRTEDAPPVAFAKTEPSKIPITTASEQLPPPKKAAASNGPSPACPQCEAPMAWVEEHLRFYCKSCRMYF